MYWLKSSPELEEDLQVSFGIQPHGDKIDVTYDFVNLGKQSALIRKVDLIEIVESSLDEDVEKKLSLCSETNANTIVMLEMGRNIMGNGVQVGGEMMRFSLYTPDSATEDGQAWGFKDMVSVGSGMTKIISATFTIFPAHRKDYNVVILCPVIDAVDIRGTDSSAVCNGFGVVDYDSRVSSAVSRERYRILPHSPDVKCPKAH